MTKAQVNKPKNYRISEFNSLRIRTAAQIYKEKFPKRDWLLQPWLRKRMLVQDLALAWT